MVPDEFDRVGASKVTVLENGSGCYVAVRKIGGSRNSEVVAVPLICEAAEGGGTELDVIICAGRFEYLALSQAHNKIDNIPGPAEQIIPSLLCVQFVVAGSAVKIIVADPSEQLVLIRTAVKTICSLATNDVVITIFAIQLVYSEIQDIPSIVSLPSPP